MTDVEAPLTKAYNAHDRRDFDALSARLRPAIDWPDPIAGGRLIGHEAIRAYWARNKAGQVWSEQCVRHCYTLHDGLISRMDVVDDKEPSSAP